MGRWTNISVFKDFDFGRRVMRPVTRKVVRAELLSRLSPGQTVLEFGAGIGELRHNLIGRDLPPGVKWIETEQCPDFLNSPREFASTRLQALLPNLPVEDKVANVVTGLGVLDVLTLHELKRSFREFARVLDKGGKVIEILDMVPDLFPLIFEAEKRGEVAFRYIKQENDFLVPTGLFYVNNEKLKAKGVTDLGVAKIISFLEKAGWDSNRMIQDLESHPDINFFVQEYLAKIGLVESVDEDLTAAYKAKLELAAKESGFKIEKSANVSAKAVVARESLPTDIVPPFVNICRSVNGRMDRLADRDRFIENPNLVTIEQEPLVFIAEKG